MNIKGFKDYSDPTWESYEKIYKTFRLVVSRHKIDYDIGKYNAYVIDLEDSITYVNIAENIDINWIEMFDKIFK